MYNYKAYFKNNYRCVGLPQICRRLWASRWYNDLRIIELISYSNFISNHFSQTPGSATSVRLYTSVYYKIILWGWYAIWWRTVQGSLRLQNLYSGVISIVPPMVIAGCSAHGDSSQVTPVCSSWILLQWNLRVRDQAFCPL